MVQIHPSPLAGPEQLRRPTPFPFLLREGTMYESGTYALCAHYPLQLRRVDSAHRGKFSFEVL